MSYDCNYKSINLNLKGEIMENTIESLLVILRKTTGRLRLISMVIAFLTIMNISLLFNTGLLTGYTDTISVVTLVVVMVLLTFFDIRRRRGNTFYEVLCTELQWRVMSEEEIRIAREQTAKSDETSESKIPDIVSRTTIRNYLHSNHLPIFPGAIGLPIYGCVNFFVALIVVYGIK